MRGGEGGGGAEAERVLEAVAAAVSAGVPFTCLYKTVPENFSYWRSARSVYTAPTWLHVDFPRPFKASLQSFVR